MPIKFNYLVELPEQRGTALPADSNGNYTLSFFPVDH
jgi:hypothetical protein